MKHTEPIKKVTQINAIKHLLKWSGKIRDLLLFELGINSALRISDLLNIQCRHLFSNGFPVDEFEMIESKTGKVHRITITPKVKETLAIYAITYPSIISQDNAFIFFHSKYSPLWSKAIHRTMAWLLIQKRCKSIWLQWSYWWHSLRKTWWFNARVKGVPIELIQYKLNHSNIAVTKKYLWISDDELRDVCLKMDL